MTTVSFIAAKGGVGKSSLATGFAWELMNAGFNMLLVDADQRVASQMYCAARAAERHSPCPTIVSLGENMHRAEHLPKLRKAFDHTIIDTAGFDDSVQRSAMLVSDIVVVPICPSRYDFVALRRTLQTLDEARIVRPTLKAFVCLTRLTRRTNLAEEASEALVGAGVPLLKARTWHRMAWPEATEEGVGVATYAPKSKAADELRAVMREVLPQLKWRSTR
jgi:chromosome partitioning protein